MVNGKTVLSRESANKKEKEMRSLRLFLVFIFLLAATAVVAAQDKPKEIYVYTDSDTNISDWWTNTLIPAFEKENPQYKVVLTIVRGVGGGNTDIANRALAALDTGDDPQVDFFETISTDEVKDWVDKKLFLEIDKDNVPNIENVVEATNRLPDAIPYRGSQVLLAYNSENVKEDEVPKTYADLIQWIKDHPGKFVYNRPDKGGSGAAMVTRAIFEVTGKDPSLFVAGESKKELIDQFPKAWELLASVHDAIYENGSYPAGNTPVLELFANGSVDMITAWSDQALQAMNKELLPDTTKFAQLQDLPFTGGYAYSGIPSNSTNQEGALALANFLLTPEVQASVVQEIGGFPAISWSDLPKELQTQFLDVITDTVPTWPGGDYGSAMVEGWYKNVATNIVQGS
jgi:putative spermidine/putrescine transport system substrate-binding protein